jgi:hypothetical protein
MTLIAPLARADDDRDEKNEISFHAGLMSLSDKLGGPKATSGVAYGLRYLRATAVPSLGFGVDFDFLKSKETTSDTLVANGRATTQIDSSAIFGIMRIGAYEGTIQPNFLLGLGAHLTSLQFAAQPKPGFVWADTGTTENRDLVDGTGLGVAIKVQAGADYSFSDNFLAGGFLGWNYLGSATYGTTNQAKALGLNNVKGSLSAIIFGADLTARF